MKQLTLPENAIEQNDGIKWKTISQIPIPKEGPQPVVNNTQMAHKRSNN